MEKSPQQPSLSHGKSSLSESFRKFTNDTFTWRPTATSATTSHLPKSTSLASVSVLQQSRLPTPSGIPRSTSFFGGLNHHPPRARRDGHAAARENAATIPETRKEPSFQATGQQQRHPQPATSTGPPVPHGASRTPSIQIEQRRLMQPVLPSLPLSTSSGNLNIPIQTQQYHHHQHHHYHHHHPSSAWPISGGESNSSSSGGSENRQRRITISQPERRPAGSMISSREHIKTPIPTRKAVRDRKNSHAVAPPPPPPPPITPSRPGGQLGQGSAAVSRVSRFSEGFGSKSSPQARPQTNQKGHSSAKERENGKHDIDTEAKSTVDRSQVIRESPSKNLLSCQSHEAGIFLDTGDRGDVEIEPPDPNLVSFLYRRNSSLPTAGPLSLIFSLLKKPQVHTSQPTTYWLGRYTALSDRFRSSGLPSFDPPTPTYIATSQTPNFSTPITAAARSPTSPSFRHDPIHNTLQRNRRVFTQLRALCGTEEASQSLDEFHKQWEKKFPNGEDAGESNERSKGRKTSQSRMGPQSKLVREKKSWLEGLIGGVGKKFS